jgi:hypothetical protein
MRWLRPAVILAAVAVFFIAAAVAMAQERPGIGVDARGGAVIDPTKNVLDLVQAAIQRQDDLRYAEAKYQNALREKEADISRVSREAESRRINELSAQKQLFDLELARVLRANVDAASLLLATQLKEVKQDLSDRMAKQEQFRWETGGRGAGYGDAFGWVMAGIMALVAGAALFWKRA